jgi:hypothetical protein
MSDSEDTTDWRELREFRGVDLAGSFVLSWRVEGRSLQLDVDLSLLPQHPFYEAPRRPERGCYHAALLEFPACIGIALRDDDESTRPLAAVARALGPGRIEGLRRTSEGEYEIRGAFGEVGIRSDRPLLRLKAATP